MAPNTPRLDDAVSPDHYKLDGIEVYDFIEQVCARLPGDEAAAVTNIIKYISRYRSKDDGHSPIVHLEKARWYFKKLIRRVEEKARAEAEEGDKG